MDERFAKLIAEINNLIEALEKTRKSVDALTETIETTLQKQK